MKRTQNRKFDLIKFLIGIPNGDFFRFSLGTMEGSAEGIRPSFSGAPYAGAGGGGEEAFTADSPAPENSFFQTGTTKRTLIHHKESRR